MTVFYHSTGGDEWTECSATNATSNATCVGDDKKKLFLSEESECQWGGITCDREGNIQNITFGMYLFPFVLLNIHVNFHVR